MQTPYPPPSPQPPLPPPRKGVLTKEGVHEESLASLVTSAQQDLVRLIDAEKALARKEIEDKVSELKREAILLAGGAVVAGLFLLCLVTAGILALSLVVAPAVAALIVCAVLGATAAALLVRFKTHIQHFDPVPHETIASVKRDVQAVQEAVR